MAYTVLPPGNKFKILSAYEVIQLAEVLKASPHIKESITNLEDKWRGSEDVYDIDLFSTTATPLSEIDGYRRGEDGEVETQKKKMAKEIQKRRMTYRKRPVVKKRKVEKRKKSSEVKEADLECGQGDAEWEKVFKDPQFGCQQMLDNNRDAELNQLLQTLYGNE